MATTTGAVVGRSAATPGDASSTVSPLATAPAPEPRRPRVLLIGSGGAGEAYAKQIAAIPRHELVMAKDAKHFVMLDAPDFSYATLERFRQ